MSDTTYFLILVTVVVCVVIGVIYRALTKSQNTKKGKKHIYKNPSSVDRSMEKELDDNDIVTNPVFSFSKLNLFHKDRHDD